MNKKVSFLFIFFVFFFLFMTDIHASEKRCVFYDNSEAAASKNKIELFFSNGSLETKRTMSAGSISTTSFNFSNSNEVLENFSKGILPNYVVFISKWTENWDPTYYAVYSNEDLREYASQAGVFTKVTTYYFADCGDSVKTYVKTYEPRSTKETQKFTLMFTYDFSTAHVTSIDSSLGLKEAYIIDTFNVEAEKNLFLTKVALPVIEKGEYPKNFYCMVKTDDLKLPVTSDIINKHHINNGDMLCSINQAIFGGTWEGMLEFVSSKADQDPDPDAKDPDDDEDKGHVDVPNVNDNISAITTGQICQSNNFKVPLKYVGWVLSALKVIIPLIIIILGVLDFFKAITSAKSDEIQKALKTVITRVIAGIIIFFVPMIIDFVFTLVDEWSNYSTYYSECTKCLFDPKNC